MRIGVISDTHGLLRPEVFEAFRGVDHILHSGDIGGEDVLDELRREPANVVIFGHSHLPHDERVGGVWYFNPASAGPRRFDYPVSVGIFEKTGATWRARHVPLDARSERALAAHMNQLSNR